MACVNGRLLRAGDSSSEPRFCRCKLRVRERVARYERQVSAEYHLCILRDPIEPQEWPAVVQRTHHHPRFTCCKEKVEHRMYPRL
jgi:hypothetical protein